MAYSNTPHHLSILCVGFNSTDKIKFDSYFSEKEHTIQFIPHTHLINANLLESSNICFVYTNNDFSIENLIELYNKDLICLMGKNESCALIMITNNAMYCLQPKTDCSDIERFISKILTQSVTSTIEADCLFDSDKGQLLCADKTPIPLTKMETTLLTAMINAENNYIGREELISLLKLNLSSNFDLILNTTICRLRKKLADFNSCITIKTWRNNGYSIEGPSISIKQPKEKCPHC